MVLGVTIPMFLLAVVWPVAAFIATGIYAASGKYEGQKEEEEYDIDCWYHTWG